MSVKKIVLAFAIAFLLFAFSPLSVYTNTDCEESVYGWVYDDNPYLRLQFLRLDLAVCAAGRT